MKKVLLSAILLTPLASHATMIATPCSDFFTKTTFTLAFWPVYVFQYISGIGFGRDPLYELIAVILNVVFLLILLFLVGRLLERFLPKNSSNPTRKWRYILIVAYVLLLLSTFIGQYFCALIGR